MYRNRSVMLQSIERLIIWLRLSWNGENAGIRKSISRFLGMLNNNINPFCRLYRLIKHSRFKIGRSMLSLTEMYFHSAAYRHTGGPLLENELHHSPRSNDHRFAHHHRWIRDNPFPSCFYCLTTCLQDDNRLTCGSAVSAAIAPGQPATLFVIHACILEWRSRCPLEPILNGPTP